MAYVFPMQRFSMQSSEAALQVANLSYSIFWLVLPSLTLFLLLLAGFYFGVLPPKP